MTPPLDVVTGAYGYTGRYLAQHLLQAGRSVRTLTGNPARPDLFGGLARSFANLTSQDVAYFLRYARSTAALRRALRVRTARTGMVRVPS